jgi:RNA polymerase sigma factor (sigma-70 family)
VELARLPAGTPAVHELLRRFSDPTSRLVGRLAVRLGLQDADRLDAQQEAVFWTLEAIRQYRTDDPARARRCRFRSFLYRVVTARFIDYFRRQRRRERPVGARTSAADKASGAPDAADVIDVHTCVEQELDRLGPRAKRLWGLLVDGVSLRRAADELGISYDKAKRERRHLLVQLRIALAC